MSDLAAPGERRADLRYVVIADDIENRILSTRELKPGQRLISERDLAAFYSCSYGTIRRVMKELRARELIQTIHGRGTFILPPPNAGMPPRLDGSPNGGHTLTGGEHSASDDLSWLRHPPDS